MKKIKLALAFVLLFSSSLQAIQVEYETGCGMAYEESKRAPCLAPIATFGAIILIALIFAVSQGCQHSCHSE